MMGFSSTNHIIECVLLPNSSHSVKSRKNPIAVMGCTKTMERKFQVSHKLMMR